MNESFQNCHLLANQSKTKSISNENWNAELNNNIKISQVDMNKLVLNYLIVEGHKDAASKFIKEANLDYTYNDKLLEKRMNIRKLIIDRNIDSAINEINNISTQIGEKNPQIHFELQKQKGIVLIKANKVEDAVLFAKNTLYPITHNNEKGFSELEKIMALLAFDNLALSPFKDIGTTDKLKRLSSLVNLEILASQMEPTDLILPLVLKLLSYTQNELKKEFNFPEIISVSPGSISKVEE